MPASWRREEDRVKFVVVERDGVVGERQSISIQIEEPTPTTKRILRRSYAKRQSSTPELDILSDIESDSESEDEDDYESIAPPSRPFTIPSATPTVIPALANTPALGDTEPTQRSPANKGPAETVVSSSGMSPSESAGIGERQGGISQTTEHLLIAAGSIGATIVIVMVILGLYTMRRRGLTISDVIRDAKDTLRRRGSPPPPPKYDMDQKQGFDDYVYAGRDVYPPRQAAKSSRSGSLSTQTPLQPLGRSDSFNNMGLERNNPLNKTFLLDKAPSRQNSHRRDISATPSSPVLPIQDLRRSDSTQNTRSLRGDEEALEYADQPRKLSALPAPPTFRQFLSNRPSISQRPGLGGAMASRFSWTNSNAPQTPHDPSRDTVTARNNIGRDSFMTQRSSVPRFRTIDSWVNQQSTRVAEQRLKQQFRMTQSTTYSDEDSVPEMPPVPKPAAGKESKHMKHDTLDTAPIFKQHPGTEVRFSTRSTVPSEVLDMGRNNVAL